MIIKKEEYSINCSSFDENEIDSITIRKYIDILLDSYDIQRDHYPILQQCYEVLQHIKGEDYKDKIYLYIYTLHDQEVWYVLECKYSKFVNNNEFTYNYYYNKITGETFRYGQTVDCNPEMCNLGPEILDLEISVNGCPTIGGANCKYCYKNNTNAAPINMSFETFVEIISRFPKNLSQIAFGITGMETNPDFPKMLQYCYENGITPNYTTSGAGITKEKLRDPNSQIRKVIDATSKYCGAVAVSCYTGNKELCYNTMKLLHAASLGRLHINMHIVLSKDNMNHIFDVLQDIKDGKLQLMRNVVFLRIKPVGRAAKMDTSLSIQEMAQVIDYCDNFNIGYGFDSCSAMNAIEIYKKQERFDLIKYCEPCESSKFSSYINVKGEYWHCSFCENLAGHSGIDVLNYDNINSIWLGGEIEKFRNPENRVSKSCQAFDLDLS